MVTYRVPVHVIVVHVPAYLHTCIRTTPKKNVRRVVRSTSIDGGADGAFILQRER